MKISQQGVRYVSATFLALLVGYISMHLFASSLIKPNALIGIATLQGIDVSARVRQFYLLVFLAGLSFFVFNFIFERWQKLIQHSWVFPLCLSGIMTLVMAFTAPKNFHATLIIILLLASTLFLFKNEKNRLIYILLSVSLTVYFSTFLPLRGMLFHAASLGTLGIISFTTFWILQGNFTLDKILSSILPLLGLPLIYPLATESYLILNQHNIYVFSPIGWQLTYLVITLIWVAVRYKKQPTKSANKAVFSYFFVASIATFTLYRPFYTYTGELFELANPANAVMRHFAFNEWPFIDYFSSHFLSEQFPQWLYVTLNGYAKDVSFMIYAFIGKVVGVLAGYWFLRQLVSTPWAILILFLFPFTNILIPPTFVLALVSIRFIYLYFTYRTTSKLYRLLFWILAITLWRIDYGAAIVPAVSMLFLLDWLYRKDFVEIKKILIHVSVFIALFMLLLVGTNILFNGQLFIHLLQALDYLGASQAHGYPQITSAFTTAYFLHYYIFPSVASILLVHLLMRTWKSKNAYSVETISSVFIGLFYLFNAQRGLVRHGFIEGSDLYISSFFFLFIATYTLHYFKRSKASIFLIASFAMILAFHFPNVSNATSLGSQVIKKTVIAKGVKNSKEKIDRVIYSDDFEKSRFDSISQFIATNLKPAETFIDFTHTPMLYFFSQRKVPSYFNQYLQNTITPGLQKKNIATLNAIGLVIFKHVPTNPLDAIDGVPNELRYFYLTNYIYANFTPDTVAYGYSFWKKKEEQPAHKSFTETTEIAKSTLYKWPAYLGETSHYAKKQNVNITGTDLTFSMATPHISDAFEIEFDEIPSSATHPVWIHYYDENNTLIGEIEFTLFSQNNNNTFVAPVGFQYNWVLQKKSRVTFTYPTYLRIKSFNLVAYAP